MDENGLGTANYSVIDLKMPLLQHFTFFNMVKLVERPPQTGKVLPDAAWLGLPVCICSGQECHTLPCFNDTQIILFMV